MRKPCVGFCVLLLVIAVACSDEKVAEGDTLTLLSLTVSAGNLTPTFNPAITSYSVSVVNAVSSILITGVPGNNADSVSYDPDQPAMLIAGPNQMIVRVINNEETALKTYRVTVVRAPSTNADLASLSIGSAALTPSFDTAVTNYLIAVHVSNTAAVTAVTVHPGAVVASIPVLSVGSNLITICVTAEDGITTKQYTLKFYRMGEDYLSARIGSLVFIPSGTFQRDADPANTSFVSAFRMSTTEITRTQYSNVMGIDPCLTGASSGSGDPVQNVNWYQAVAFCNKLSIAEGYIPVYSVSNVNFTNLLFAGIPTVYDAVWNAAQIDWNADGYRLPTEMEWMWAALGAQMGGDPFAVNTAGYTKPFAGYKDGTTLIGSYAWYDGNSGTTTHPAGDKSCNELGLYDMSGNVWEWCWDWYDDIWPGYSITGHVTDYRGAVPGTTRVIRGGSWDVSASANGVGYRNSLAPNNRGSAFGFRVVRR